MNRPLLNDRNEYPDDGVLARHLQKAKSAWDAFSARLAAECEGASLEWRYYNDGKAWLCKLTRKKKTVCWISVWDRFFKTTFYFTGKCDQGIEALEISQGAKDSYRAGEPIGKLKPLTIDVRSRKALEDVFTLIAYKSSLK